MNNEREFYVAANNGQYEVKDLDNDSVIYSTLILRLAINTCKEMNDNPRLASRLIKQYDVSAVADQTVSNLEGVDRS